MMNQLDLNDIKLFVACVQAGSLSKASDCLNIPKSRLSRRLTELEQHLGTTLVDRGRNGIVLNEIGKTFYRYAQAMLQTAQKAVDAIHTDLSEPSGTLRLSIANEIGRELILPYLSDYLQQYPKVSLEIQLCNKKVHLIQEGVDIVLRVGTIENENVVAKKLCEIEFGLFASDEYIKQNGLPQSPYELNSHSLLYKTDGPAWLFSQQDQLVEISTQNKVAINDFNAIAQLIDYNLGIGLLPQFISCQPHWIQILPDWNIRSSPLSIVYYKHRGNAPLVSSMVQFIQQKLNSPKR